MGGDQARTHRGALAEGDDLCRIYLICDQEDNPLDSPTRSALALRDFLFDLGFEVKLPVAGKTAAKSRQKDNPRKLEECDAVVLYWGLAPQTWVEEQLSGLKKALGWRRAPVLRQGHLCHRPGGR